MPHSDHSPNNSSNASQPTPTRNLRKLAAKIDQTIIQLQKYYTFDRDAIRAQQALTALKKLLNQTTISKSIRKIPDEINAFAAAKEYDERSDSLLYPLYIAFAEAFPGNKKEKGKLLAFNKAAARSFVSTPITNLAETIPARDNLLHFTQFVIKEDDFPWQDKLSAVYHDIQRDVTFNHNVQLADNLFIAGQKEKIVEPDSLVTYLHQDYIDYYYYMLDQGVSKKHLLYWHEAFQKEPDLGVWVTLLCEYQNLLQEVSYASVDQDALTSQLEVLAEEIQEHPLTPDYLSSEEALTVQIDKLLANLVSPAVHRNQPALSKALSLSERARVQLEKSFKSEQVEYDASNPLLLQYQKLSNSNHFSELLACTRQSGPEFFNELCKLPENEVVTIIQSLSTAGVVPIISSTFALLDNGVDSTLASEKIFDVVKLKKLVDAIRQSHRTLSPELSDFIKNYNEEDPTNPINLTVRQIKKLQRLDILSQEFDKILQNNSFAFDVLSKNGCYNLIDALENHGNLSEQLKSKQFKEILSLADNYYKNSRENIILHAIALGLDPEKGLSLDGPSRKNWIGWRNGLHDIIKTTYGGVEETEENCDRYIAQRIPLLLAQYDTTDQSIEEAMDDDIKHFDTLVFAGLFQCKVLSPEEIFSLSPEKTYYFYRVNQRLSQHRERIAKEAYCNNPIEIIAGTKEIQSRRAALDELKSQASDSKEAMEAYRLTLDEYVNHLLAHTRIIGINLHSIYASFVDELAKMGIQSVSLQETLSLPQAQLAKLKNDREEGQSYFRKHLPIFKNANINEFAELLKVITAAKSDISINKVYDQGLQVTKKYSRSISIEAYYKAGLLESKHVFTLTPEIFNVLEKQKANFLSPKHKSFKTKLFQRVFQEVVATNIQTNRTEISQDIARIVPYLECRILSKIAESNSTLAKGFVHASLKENRYLPELEAEWINRLSNLGAHVQQGLALYNNSRTHLLALAYQQDTQAAAENFSFEHVIKSMEGYLTNLANERCNVLIKAGYALLPIMHLTIKDIQLFAERYETLQTLLTPAMLDDCMQTVRQNGQSIQELSNALNAAYITLTHSPISAFLQNFTKTLPDDLKRDAYNTFGEYCIVHNTAARIAAQAMEKGAFSFVTTILQMRHFTLREILSSNLDDFQELENKLSEALANEDILTLLDNIPADQSNPAAEQSIIHLLLLSYKSRNKPRELISNLTGRLDRLMEENKLRTVIEAGISVKNAFHLSPTSLDHAHARLLGLYRQLEHSTDPFDREGIEQRIRDFINDRNDTRTHKHRHRDSRQLSTQLSSPEDSTPTRVHPRQKVRTPSNKHHTRASFFGKLGDKFVPAGKHRHAP